MVVGNLSQWNSDKATAVNVWLKPGGEHERPQLVNYTHVGIDKGLAYVEFGVLEPALLGLVARRVKQGEAIPQQLNGTKAAGVSLPLPSAIRLNQQLQQMLGSLQPPKPKQS